MSIYRFQKGMQPRWASFENPKGLKGQGGQENKGAKGHAFERFAAGETKTLMQAEGAGIVQRMWITISDRAPQILRSIRLEMFWDNAETPAVSAPLGDFFCFAHGRMAPFENAFFSSPEGRSFNCCIPMPFRTGARIQVTNESDTDLTHVFYDVNYSLVEEHDETTMYFHTHWRRETTEALCEDFAILPKVSGAGRFLGVNFGLITDPRYGRCWWGEGEVKAYIDGDTKFPTLVGTGAEDYLGAAWCLGPFINRNQGCAVADPDNRAWGFYRFHIPDPIFFAEDCRITVQQIGGARRDKLLLAKEAGAPFHIVSLDKGGDFKRLFEANRPVDPASEEYDENTWFNFYRRDDWFATAYFYLDKPENSLPPLPSANQRAGGLPEAN